MGKKTHKKQKSLKAPMHVCVLSIDGLRDELTTLQNTIENQKVKTIAEMYKEVTRAKSDGSTNVLCVDIYDMTASELIVGMCTLHHETQQHEKEQREKEQHEALQGKTEQEKVELRETQRREGEVREREKVGEHQKMMVISPFTDNFFADGGAVQVVKSEVTFHPSGGYEPIQSKADRAIVLWDAADGTTHEFRKTVLATVLKYAAVVMFITEY